MSAAVAEFRDPTVGRGFTQLENAVLFDTRLTPGARLVYCALKHYAWKGSGEVPPQPELAAALGVSERSVRTHLKELVDEGLITMQRRRSKPNLYVIEPYPVQANIAGTVPANPAASIRQNLPEPSIKTLKKGSTDVEPALEAPAPPAKTPIALMFEAFEAEVKRSPLTKSERGKWARGFAELVTADVLPEHLSALCRAYRKEWPQAELTPTALAANLSKFATKIKPPKETEAERVRALMAEKGIR